VPLRGKPLGSPETLRSFREGERAALEAVYLAYVAEIELIGRRGFLCSTAGVRIPGVAVRADLRDFVHEVFSKAFSRRAREGFDGKRDYGAYITTIARNVLIDRARASGREVPLSSEVLDGLVVALENDGEEWPSGDAAGIVRRYLSELSPELRAVYYQRYELGLFQATAATNLGLSRQTLRTLENKLRKGLARALKRQQLSLPAMRGRAPEPGLTPPAIAHDGVDE
jgi:RNA polymerase sigma factor (sigma-70 family)